MLLEAFILPGNKILPLGGIIAMVMTPALLVVCQGKMIRMLIISIFMIPLFLYSATLFAPMVTDLANQVGAFPSGINDNTMISHSTLENPYWMIMAVTFGKFVGTKSLQLFLLLIFLIGFYTLAWFIYVHDIKKKNLIYQKEINVD